MEKRSWIYKLVIVSLVLFATILQGCGNSDSAKNTGSDRIISDSLGREVHIPEKVKKVVVVNRYNMEIVKSIDALPMVIGVDYGIYQDRDAYGSLFQKNQVVSSGNNDLNYEHIIKLQPDVLILPANRQWKEAEKKLQPFGIAVVVVNPYYTKDFVPSYTIMGEVFGKQKQAKEFIDYFWEKKQYVDEKLKDVPRKKVYLEYKTPGRTTIPGDYFNEMVEYAHGDNIYKDAGNVNIDVESVIQRNPDYIVKIGDGRIDPKYIPPTEKEFLRRRAELVNRPGWGSINAVRDGHILLLSQYVHGGASKLVGSFYIAKYLYPEELKDLNPEEIFRVWVEKYQHLPYIKGHTWPAFQ